MELVAKYAISWVLICLIMADSPFSDPFLVLDTLHTALFKSLASPPSELKPAWLNLGTTKRTLLHTSFHTVFISMLVLLVGRRTILASWVGCAYLFGAWLVILTGLWIATFDVSLADEVALNAADAYTTPWHWCAYSLMGQSDLAYPILIYNFYRGVIALYAYPVAFTPMVQAQLAANADGGALLKFLLVFVPFYNYVAVWLVITPRLLRFKAHSASLWQKAMGGEKLKQA